MNDIHTRCGLIAIIGRPNVGKSTLLNHLLGEKLSITSRKPQTTRYQLLGVKTLKDVQMIYVDTPGIHLGKLKAINKAMNREAASALHDVDLILLVTDRGRWNEEDQHVLELADQQPAPKILIINKIDLVDRKRTLLPVIADLCERSGLQDVLPISALHNQGLDALEQHVARFMPHGPHLFPANQLTDRGQRFLASELIREKIVRQLGEELPYSTAVEIEVFTKDSNEVMRINAVILVERRGQKKIIIGENGDRLKTIGTDARKDMERAFGSKVMLKLWVKVKSGWSDDARALKALGLNPLEEE